MATDDDILLKRIGAAVRNARLRAGISQQQAGAAAGMSRERWSRLEGGYRNVKLFTVKQAAVAVGSTLAKIVVEAFPDEARDLMQAIHTVKKGALIIPEPLPVGRKRKKKARGARAK